LAKVKYNIKDVVSTIVVIKGAAIIAGSNLSFCAAIGSIAPIIFAITTVKNNVTPTTKAIVMQ
jgi:hypothetical protein